MLDFFRKLLAVDFMPHGHCYFWRPEIVWLHVTSDALIAAAYFVIPFVLIHLIRRRRDLVFDWMFMLFGVFILACGATHLMSIWTLWHPVYRLDGLIKAITAFASVPTAFLLVRLVPQAIQLPSPAQLRTVNRALESQVVERAAAEERVRELNVSLERRVAERTHELLQANEQLTKMNEDLKHFAYAASHDLMEPLRMVVAYNQLLERKYAPQLPPSAKELLEYSANGARRMQELLDGLRDYWQVSERGEERRNAVNCASAVEVATLNLQTAIVESEAVVTYDPLPVVDADDVMLVQLFQNLIGNAIKYRGKAAPLVHVSATREEHQWLFAVTDNGAGIDPEYRESIFGVFKRLHGREYPGIGMGLALCRRVVERHGGRIWTEAAPGGQGSAFKFTIPIA